MTAPTLAATDIGIEAREALRRGRTGRVEAVFGRSVYVSLGDDWLCLGTAGIGRGPINVLIDGPITLLGARLGDVCVATGRGVRVGSAEVDAGRAAVWRAASPAASTPAQISEALAALVACGGYARMDGLGCFIGGARPENRTARAAAPAVARLAGWVGRSPPAAPAPPDAVARLLGLGPGLTPSGDDFLAGCIAALRMIGGGPVADALWSEVKRQAPAATSALSFAHLRAANRSSLAEPVHEILRALIEGRVAAVAAAVAVLAAAHSSSPFDAVAGAVLPLRHAASLIDRHRQSRAPAALRGRATRLP